MEIRANEVRGSGRDGVSPSGSWSVRSLNRSFPGLSGEVGMARGTRALPGGGSGLGPLVEIRAKGGGWFACKARFGRVLLRSTRGGLVVGLAPWGGSWVVASRFLGWSAILRADEVEARWEGS